MNWKYWGCVAAVGLMSMAQGIAFKDAPTIQSILEQYGKDKTDFKLMNIRSGEYKWTYIFKGQKITGALAYRVKDYRKSMDNGLAFLPIKTPKNINTMSKEQIIDYVNESSEHDNIPIGAYLQGVNLLGIIGNDNTVNRQALYEIIPVMLKECYGMSDKQIVTAQQGWRFG